MEAQLGKPSILSILQNYIYNKFMPATRDRDATTPWFLPATTNNDATTPWFLPATTDKDGTIPYLPSTTGRRLQPP